MLRISPGRSWLWLPPAHPQRGQMGPHSNILAVIRLTVQPRRYTDITDGEWKTSHNLRLSVRLQQGRIQALWPPGILAVTPEYHTHSITDQMDCIAEIGADRLFYFDYSAPAISRSNGRRAFRRETTSTTELHLPYEFAAPTRSVQFTAFIAPYIFLGIPMWRRKRRRACYPHEYL